MADKTGISWTDATWNPLRGCSKVSAGCKNCYAEKVAARFSGPGQPYEGTIRDGRWNGQNRLVPEMLAQPLKWKRSRRIFVNSMSDLFHEGVPFEYIAAVFGVMAACPQHTFQALTKRPARALEFFKWLVAGGESGFPLASICVANAGASFGCYLPDAANCVSWPLPNVHLGVSVEDQETADARIPLLLQCPAAVRFVSYEPALGPVDFTRIPYRGFDDDIEHFNPLRDGAPRAYGSDPSKKLHWIIVGGESGPGARPFDVAWARSTIAQCKAAGVACFVKQMGAHVYDPRLSLWGGPYPTMRAGTINLFDRAGADPSEWPEDLRVQEFPA